jgi:hypothetical protein
MASLCASSRVAAAGPGAEGTGGAELATGCGIALAEDAAAGGGVSPPHPRNIAAKAEAKDKDKGKTMGDRTVESMTLADRTKPCTLAMGA